MMPVESDTFASRRHLPHLERPERTYFVTFTTINRLILTPAAKTIALACCVYEHLASSFLHVAVVMPDHVHLILAPYDNWRLSAVMRRVKGISSRQMNLAMGRAGQLWQDESFDRIIRSGEDIRKKSEYLCMNPVRAGLVSSPDEYPWLWREWVEGRRNNQFD